MDDDAPRMTRMDGPVRPQWGELDAVVRSLVAQGATREQVLEAAREVALEEDLDPRRAEERALGVLDDD